MSKSLPSRKWGNTMFTGIIEEIGTIHNMRQTSKESITMTVRATHILQDMNLGDSITVDGICLTVAGFTSESFQIDAMPETIYSTALSRLQTGSQVNLERSMKADGRFGGHFVSGHIDSAGKIVKKQKRANAIEYEIQVPDVKFLLKKGSVAVDGISLTVFHMKKNGFTISLIPHTTSATTLGQKDVGDLVNIEYDLLGKYVHNLLATQSPDSRRGMDQTF